MKLTKSQLIKIIKEELENLAEAEEAWVLERSGVTFAEKFVVGGSPQDPKFGSLGQAKTFGSKEAAKSFATKSDIHVSVKSKESLSEAYGGALGSFPERYGEISPRRGHPMYKADDELREIGSNIGNILSLTERAITDLKTMQARYGEMAHMGAYANITKEAAQQLSEKYRDALDRAHTQLSRPKQLGEKELTKPEKKEKERLVKGMKKDASGFEKRYPGRGEEVMYATATKQAKKRK